MNWIDEANRIFSIEKPAHFTNFNHCCECAEHDETLRSCNVDTIGLDALGNPGWDPVCFCSDTGKRYYMPAFIRLSIDTVNSDFYFDQFLFHLEKDGPGNSLVLSCSAEQRKYIAQFIEYMIADYANEIDRNLCSDQVLRVYEIWSDVEGYW